MTLKRKKGNNKEKKIKKGGGGEMKRVFGTVNNKSIRNALRSEGLKGEKRMVH